jgi:hypothetical protein
VQSAGSGLIAYESPLYEVLSLDDDRGNKELKWEKLKLEFRSCDQKNLIRKSLPEAFPTSV